MLLQCNTCMPVISVRVDDELKRKMDKYRYINWSEVIRTEIAKIIERFESRNLAEALLINEKLRRKSTVDTTEIIREWRKRRYGESGS